MNAFVRELLESELEALEETIAGNENQREQATARVQTLTSQLRTLAAQRDAVKEALGQSV